MSHVPCPMSQKLLSCRSQMLEAREVRKVYRNGQVTLEVLHGVNLRIERGEFIAITGPSGAGKSTLLHLLAGLDAPSSGEVLWDDQPLWRMTERQRAYFRNRTIGVVFQFYHLLPELTALENVMLPGLVGNHVPRRQLQARAHTCLERVGLTPRAAHKPSQLSGGELQRAAIARALINEPQLLLCDEPTGNLDSHTGAGIAQLLSALHQQRHFGIVLVTHAAELASRADRDVVLRDGRIVKADAPGGVPTTTRAHDRKGSA